MSDDLTKKILNAPSPKVADLIATRERIREDQRTNANRDAAALEREREWYRTNRPDKPLPEHLR